jgi:AcrR family transcriptional regulator
VTRTTSPRDRLLETAAALFYREGINGVGVDRVLAEAGVTRATMYRHFAGKEALVVAYLEREDANLRDLFARAGASGASPQQLVDLVIEGIAEDVTRFHTRGCPFINAAAEFPDPDSEVRQVVRRHRDWFRATLAEVVRGAGIADPEDKAAALVLLRDAALVGAYLDPDDDPVTAFRRTSGQIVHDDRLVPGGPDANR